MEFNLSGFLASLSLTAYITIFIYHASELIGKTSSNGDVYLWTLPIEVFIAFLFPAILGYIIAKGIKF